MKILMISDVFFPRINGVSTSIQTFRDDLIALGHKVTLICPEYPNQSETDEDIIRIPSRFLVMDPEDRLMRSSKILALTSQLAEEQYDVVHIQTPFVAHYLGIKLARRLDLPVVESYHTFFEEYLFHYLPLVPKGIMRWLARRFSRGQCNSVDGIIVPSSPMHAVLQAYGITTQEIVLPTGLRPDALPDGDGTAFRQKLGIAADQPTLVHIGRIAHEKNIDFLFDVIAATRKQIPELAAIIAGEGPALNHLKKRAKSLGLSSVIRFVGYLDRKTQLPSCYQAGNAFIFASKTETQGLVLLEAMSLGVPVVSTAIMGTKDILKANKAALVAEEDNLDDFVAKTVSLLKDPVLQQRLGNEGKDYTQEWSAQVMAAQLLGFYQLMIGQHQED